MYLYVDESLRMGGRDGISGYGDGGEGGRKEGREYM